MDLVNNYFWHFAFFEPRVAGARWCVLPSLSNSPKEAVSLEAAFQRRFHQIPPIIHRGYDSGPGVSVSHARGSMSRTRVGVQIGVVYIKRIVCLTLV